MCEVLLIRGSSCYVDLGTFGLIFLAPSYFGISSFFFGWGGVL